MHPENFHYHLIIYLGNFTFMNWIELNNMAQLEEIKNASFKAPVLIYKHSIRCAISSVVKNRLEKEALPEGFSYYYLDLINNRNISNAIADYFGVRHQSPQAIVLHNGAVVHHSSHFSISAKKILEVLPEQ